MRKTTVKPENIYKSYKEKFNDEILQKYQKISERNTLKLIRSFLKDKKIQE